MANARLPTTPRGSRALRQEPRARAGAQNHVLTPRDHDILRWIGRYGVVSTEQVARRWFPRHAATVGPWTTSSAYRRVGVLEDFGFLQRDQIYLRGPHLLRLTPKGARLACPGTQPAKLVPGAAGHALAVVDLAEALRPRLPDGVLVTEREIRREQIRARTTHGSADVTLKRIPDAVFRYASGGADAVELDYTAKTTGDIQRIARTYDEHYPDVFRRVLWYAPGGKVARRTRAVVDEMGLSQFILVDEWPLAPEEGTGS